MFLQVTAICASSGFHCLCKRSPNHSAIIHHHVSVILSATPIGIRVLRQSAASSAAHTSTCLLARAGGWCRNARLPMAAVGHAGHVIHEITQKYDILGRVFKL